MMTTYDGNPYTEFGRFIERSKWGIDPITLTPEEIVERFGIDGAKALARGEIIERDGVRYMDLVHATLKAGL